tara:strand:- start:932 stop:1552 length:621 start_codon:yes stop_codon:yes gene_type:complete
MYVSIYGSGSLGMQVKNLAERNGWQVVAFIDDNKNENSKQKKFDIPTYQIDDYVLRKELPSSILIAINNPLQRKEIKKKLEHKKIFNYPYLVDKNVILLSETLIGEGTIIFPGTIIDINSIIGEHCVINKLCSIGHDVKLKNFITISPQVMIGGNIFISENVFIGGSSCLREGILISKNIKIGMGSVVTKNLESEGLYYGNPLKKR